MFLKHCLLHSIINGDSIEVDCNNLDVEIPIFRQLFQNNTVVCFTDMLDNLQNLTGERCLTPKYIMIIIYILIVSPATSATPERSFRSLEELKPGNEQQCHKEDLPP